MCCRGLRDRKGGNAPGRAEGRRRGWWEEDQRIIREEVVNENEVSPSTHPSIHSSNNARTHPYPPESRGGEVFSKGPPTHLRVRCRTFLKWTSPPLPVRHHHPISRTRADAFQSYSRLLLPCALQLPAHARTDTPFAAHPAFPSSLELPHGPPLFLSIRPTTHAPERGRGRERERESGESEERKPQR